MSTEKLPPSASASGKNAYYLGVCRHVGGNPSYAACLDKIARIAKNDVVLCRDCVDPVKHGTCQAKNMQQAEQLAGQALYFIPRDSIATSHNKIPAWSEESYQPPVPKVKATPAPAPLIATGSYADAINAALKAAAPAPTPAPAAAVAVVASAAPVTPKPTPAMVPGETPIQFARRIAAQA